METAFSWDRVMKEIHVDAEMFEDFYGQLNIYPTKMYYKPFTRIGRYNKSDSVIKYEHPKNDFVLVVHIK